MTMCIHHSREYDPYNDVYFDWCNMFDDLCEGNDHECPCFEVKSV